MDIRKRKPSPETDAVTATPLSPACRQAGRRGERSRPVFTQSLYQWFISSLATILWFTPAMIICKFQPNLTLKFIRNWCRTQLKIFDIHLSVIDRNGGQYGSPPYLYLMLNQTSLIETIIIGYVIPTDFKLVTNIEWALLPFVGWLMWLRGSVVIIRQWPAQAKLGVERAARRMRRGDNFYMSIEGIRTKSSGLNPYKKGPAVLAITAQATIVPIIIHGAREILPHGEWRVNRGKVKAILCETVSTAGLSCENRGELVQRLRLIAEKELQGEGREGNGNRGG